MRGEHGDTHRPPSALDCVSGGAAHSLCADCAQGYGATGGGHDRTVLGVPTTVLEAFPHHTRAPHVRGEHGEPHRPPSALDCVSGGAAHSLCTGCAQGYGATGGGHERTVLGVPTMVLEAFPHHTRAPHARGEHGEPHRPPSALDRVSGGAAHPLCTGCAQGYGATGGGHDRTVLGVPTKVLEAFPHHTRDHHV